MSRKILNSSLGIGLPAALAGLVWLLLWAGFLLTHGPGPDNRRDVFLSFTWMDYSKFLAIPFVLVCWTFLGLHRSQGRRSGRWGKAGLRVVMLGSLLLLVGLAVDRWTLPFGSYELDRDFQVPLHIVIGRVLLHLSTVSLFLGSVLFAIGLIRARYWPAWLAAPVVVSFLSIVPWLHETEFGVVFGLSWLIVGLGLITYREERVGVMVYE